MNSEEEIARLREIEKRYNWIIANSYSDSDNMIQWPKSLEVLNSKIREVKYKYADISVDQTFEIEFNHAIDERILADQAPQVVNDEWSALKQRLLKLTDNQINNFRRGVFNITKNQIFIDRLKKSAGDVIEIETGGHSPDLVSKMLDDFEHHISKKALG